MPTSLQDRRYSNRRAVRFPARFRLLREGSDIAEMRLSGLAHGRVCDLGMHGLSMEVGRSTIDGLRIDQIVAWRVKARVYLEFVLPDGTVVALVGEPVWCERQPRTLEGIHLGVRFRELSLEAREALKRCLEQI